MHEDPGEKSVSEAEKVAGEHRLPMGRLGQLGRPAAAEALEGGPLVQGEQIQVKVHKRALQQLSIYRNTVERA